MSLAGYLRMHLQGYGRGALVTATAIIVVGQAVSEMGSLRENPGTEEGLQVEVCYSTSVSNGNGAVKPKNQMWYSL